MNAAKQQRHVESQKSADKEHQQNKCTHCRTRTPYPGLDITVHGFLVEGVGRVLDGLPQLGQVARCHRDRGLPHSGEPE